MDAKQDKSLTPRPDVLTGATYKLRWPESDHALYVTINDIVEEGRHRLYEIFVNSRNPESYAWTAALTLMISAVFRRGGDVSFVAKELGAVFDPRGGQWIGKVYVPSLLALIGETIERHAATYDGTKPLQKPSSAQNDRFQVSGVEPFDTSEAGYSQEAGSSLLQGTEKEEHHPYRVCPKCSKLALVHQEGCDVCTACGYSSCG